MVVWIKVAQKDLQRIDLTYKTQDEQVKNEFIKLTQNGWNRPNDDVNYHH